MGITEDAEKIRKQLEQEEADKLKVVFFGQPGSGKSSLINAIVGEEVAKTGQRTDVTTEAQIIECRDMILVDLPGYGTSKFPPNKWFTEFKPEQYDLFICVFSGKFHEADTNFFKNLNDKKRVCLFVRSKSDEIWDPRKTEKESRSDITNDTRKHVGMPVKVYFTSCRRNNEGISDLNEAIKQSLGPAKRDKFIRSAKARTNKHLREKKDICEKMVARYAALAAANAINPIPGADISVDMALILKLFSKIRATYGLDDEKLKSLAPFVPIANKVIKYATEEGLKILLKRFATQIGTKQVTKYIPFVGQIIASTIAFKITSAAGNSYLEDCHLLAEQILHENLNLYGGEENRCGGYQSQL